MQNYVVRRYHIEWVHGAQSHGDTLLRELVYILKYIMPESIG